MTPKVYIWANGCRTGKKCSACHKTALTPRIVLAKWLALATCPFGLLDNYMARVFTAIFTVLGAFLRAEKYFWSFGNKPLNPKFKKCPKNTLNVGNYFFEFPTFKVFFGHFLNFGFRGLLPKLQRYFSALKNVKCHLTTAGNPKCHAFMLVCCHSVILVSFILLC